MEGKRPNTRPQEKKHSHNAVLPFLRAGESMPRFYGIGAETQARCKALARGGNRPRGLGQRGISRMQQLEVITGRVTVDDLHPSSRSSMCSVAPCRIGALGFRPVWRRAESVRHVRPGCHSEQLRVMTASDTAESRPSRPHRRPGVSVARSRVAPGGGPMNPKGRVPWASPVGECFSRPKGVEQSSYSGSATGSARGYPLLRPQGRR